MFQLLPIVVFISMSIVCHTRSDSKLKYRHLELYGAQPDTTYLAF